MRSRRGRLSIWVGEVVVVVEMGVVMEMGVEQEGRGQRVWWLMRLMERRAGVIRYVVSLARACWAIVGRMAGQTWSDPRLAQCSQRAWDAKRARVVRRIVQPETGLDVHCTDRAELHQKLDQAHPGRPC
jgi:hypothetical protein